MAASQLIEGQLGEAADYMEEVDESLQVCATVIYITVQGRLLVAMQHLSNGTFSRTYVCTTALPVRAAVTLRGALLAPFVCLVILSNVAKSACQASLQSVQ